MTNDISERCGGYRGATDQNIRRDKKSIYESKMTEVMSERCDERYERTMCAVTEVFTDQKSTTSCVHYSFKHFMLRVCSF